MEDLENNLALILSEINAINCPNGKPRIVAVSKKQPLEKIKKLHELGIKEFAENFAQEAVDKITELIWMRSGILLEIFNRIKQN